MNTIKKHSLSARIMLWIHERFPLTNTPLFIILYVISLSLASALQAPPAHIFSNIIIGSVISVSFFLLLRVLDEHKDYQEDCINHPDRVLQSGIITLATLKSIGIICILLQLLLMLINPHELKSVLTAWAATLIWTLLMAKEFFAPRWLNKHFVIYALSHTLIMPFFMWWMLNIAAPGIALTLPVILLMSVSFIASLSFEITRKCKGAEEERPRIVTYSSLFGRKRAIAAILFLQASLIVLQYALITLVKGSTPLWFDLISTLIYLGCILQTACYLRKPVTSNRKKNEAVIGIAMLSGYLLTIFALY